MTQNTSNIENLKQELDSLGIKYRSNATESNLKHLLSKHKAQQPKEDKVSQNETQSDLENTEQKDNSQTWPVDLQDKELPTLESGETLSVFLNGEFKPEDGVMEFTPNTPEEINQETGLFAQNVTEPPSLAIGEENTMTLELTGDWAGTSKNYNLEDVVPTLKNEDGTTTVYDLEKEPKVVTHTDKPTFGYKNTDFDSDKILIKTNVLKGFIDQLTQAAMKGYDLSDEKNCINVLDTPYRVKLVKGKPVVVELMQPEVKVKIKVYKQSEFIKEMLRIIKLGGRITSIGNIKILSGLYVFEAIVDSNYELRKNIDFYAGKV